MPAASGAGMTPTRSPAHSPAAPTDHGPFVLGLDAGGTKTVCLLANATDGTILGRGVGGPGNIHAAGAARVAMALADAIGAAFAAAGVATETATVAAAAIGAAGAARADDRAAVGLLLRGAIAAGRYAVENDAAIALRAALPTGAGALLISGTGSIGYGRTAEGWEIRAGGWGYLLDDAGSAYAVGLAALTALLHAHDGRGPATALRGPLLENWELVAPEGIIARVYRQPPPRDEIAALAPLVLAAAREGDAVAAGIIAGAGEALGALAAATIRRLDAAPGTIVPLVTDGGFLRAGEAQLLPPLLGVVAAGGLRVAQRHATVEAAHGAVALARALLDD
jgi:N-acetylglucosamine kinase-like BadF-type ATPase